MTQEFVYHASKTSGLKKLEPRPSTHKKSWVYATKEIAFSAMFLGDNFDFICQTGTQNGKPQIYERFQGALELAYKGKKGSIYKLPSKTFNEGKTQWSAEVVSDKAVIIKEEIIVNNALSFLEKLESDENLIVYRYPNLPPNAPKDKEDIVERGINWTIDFGENTLDQIQQYHPDVLERVIAGLKKKGYKPRNDTWKASFNN
jgi:hypothetical protein